MEFSQPGYYFWINPNILIICTEISRVIQIEFWKFVIGCIVLPSTLASPFHIALVFLRVSVALLPGNTQDNMVRAGFSSKRKAQERV